MAKLGGYIFLFEEEYARTLEKRVKKNISFKETLPFNISDKYKNVQFHFISIDQENINYAVLVEQGRKPKESVIQKSQLKFYDYLKIHPCIPINDLGVKLNSEFLVLSIQNPEELYKYFIDPEKWDKLIEEIKKLRPELSDAINTMLAKVSDYSFTGLGFDLMARQKDAVQLAFNLAFDTTEKRLDYRLPNAQQGQKAKDFLKCTPNEDSCIYHDMLKFSRWHEKQEKTTPTSRTYRYGTKVLTITNVNRRECEQTLGVDLIYYNHEYKSFIMVQYKLWQKEDTRYCYRPDNQYYKDIQRMQNAEILLKEFSQNQQDSTIQRLNDSPFYFKICKPTELSYSNDMISGIYIQYQYLENLMNLNLGKRGGKIVSEEQFQNSINNQLFIDLVKNGLIGSTGIDNEQLNKIVEDLLNQGDSVTIAESFRIKTKSFRDAQRFDLSLGSQAQLFL